MDDDKKANNDKETIARLRGALASMNQDYMKTKLELDKMKGPQQTAAATTASPSQASDLGAHLFRVSSKFKAFQSNVSIKLATAGKQYNNLKQQQQQTMNEDNDDNINNDNNIVNGGDDGVTVDDKKDKKNNKKFIENRKLRDDIESLQTQITNLKLMLKTSMEEKDQLNKERNELLIKHGDGEELIKKLKEQSISDSNRYEQLLDSFRAENSSQIEIEKKKLYK
eukprot:73198_1